VERNVRRKVDRNGDGVAVVDMAQTALLHRSSRKLTRDGIIFGGLNGALTLGLGGLRLHGVKERAIDLGICIACHFVWRRLINEGVFAFLISASWYKLIADC